MGRNGEKDNLRWKYSEEEKGYVLHLKTLSVVYYECYYPKKKTLNFKLYFNSLLYVPLVLGLQELNEIYIIWTVRRTYEARKVFLKV